MSFLISDSNDAIILRIRILMTLNRGMCEREIVIDKK